MCKGIKKFSKFVYKSIKLKIMSTTAQKHIDKNIVRDAALLLMQKNGRTSSLEVKEHLRSEGFWAKQDPIRDFLYELQRELSWNKNDAGGHLEYSISTPSSSSTQNNYVQASLLDGEVISLISDTIGIDMDEVEITSLLVDDLGMDHLDTISVSFALDNEFSGKFKQGMLPSKQDWNNVKTVKDVVALLESCLDTPTVVATTTTTVKSRKPRTVINDSVNPSNSPRVTVNIDPKVTLAGGGTTAIDAKKMHDGNDWYVHSAKLQNGGPSEVCIYDQKYTSDNVRTAYARLKGIKIQDVRARRVNNL